MLRIITCSGLCLLMVLSAKGQARSELFISQLKTIVRSGESTGFASIRGERTDSNYQGQTFVCLVALQGCDSYLIQKDSGLYFDAYCASDTGFYNAGRLVPPNNQANGMSDWETFDWMDDVPKRTLMRGQTQLEKKGSPIMIRVSDIAGTMYGIIIKQF